MTKPDCAWSLADLSEVESNGVKVMTTFACGGGSSMGYKLAGCDVIAANDIDPDMAWHYQANLKPRHYFLCPIRDLLSADLPSELYELDILDGSPPCSTFSISGKREKDWGRKRHFREGQAEQVLSDLFFDYLDVVGHLKPRVAIAENVKGMLLGNAKGYCKMIMARFRELGYRPQLFLLDAADCGVPQMRKRVFFVAAREDLSAPPLKLKPRHRWITAGEATADLQELTDDEVRETAPTGTDRNFYHQTPPGQSYSGASERMRGKASFFNHQRLHRNQISPTLTAQPNNLKHWSEMRTLTFMEIKRLGGFPDDYTARNDTIGKYLVGMSVPPKMAAVVAQAVIKQWLRPSG